ncbi:unnamed protein product [Sphagnum balticum]
MTVKRGYNCIDGRNYALKSILPPEDQPNGVLRGGPGCMVCPSCVIANSECGYGPLLNRSWVFTYSTFLAYLPCLMNVDPTTSTVQFGTFTQAFEILNPFCSATNVVTICDALQWASQPCVNENLQIWFIAEAPYSYRDVRPLQAAALQAFASNLNAQNVQPRAAYPACGSGASPTGLADPTCPQGATNIQYQNFGCNCYPNFGNSNPNNPICDAQICPQNGTTNPCGAPSNGVCVPTGGTSPYLGYCKCYRGFTGTACQIQSCPSTSNTTAAPPSGLGPNLICGGLC